MNLRTLRVLRNPEHSLEVLWSVAACVQLLCGQADLFGAQSSRPPILYDHLGRVGSNYFSMHHYQQVPFVQSRPIDPFDARRPPRLLRTTTRPTQTEHEHEDLLQCIQHRSTPPELAPASEHHLPSTKTPELRDGHPGALRAPLELIPNPDKA